MIFLYFIVILQVIPQYFNNSSTHLPLVLRVLLLLENGVDALANTKMPSLIFRIIKKIPKIRIKTPFAIFLFLAGKNRKSF